MNRTQMLLCGRAIVGILLVVLSAAIVVNSQAASGCNYPAVLALPDVADCTKYYRCDETNLIIASYYCESPLFFNPKTMGCESPELVDCELPTV